MLWNSQGIGRVAYTFCLRNNARVSYKKNIIELFGRNNTVTLYKYISHDPNIVKDRMPTMQINAPSTFISSPNSGYCSDFIMKISIDKYTESAFEINCGIWLICLQVGNDHMDIRDIKYSPGKESKRASNYFLIDTLG